MFFSEPDNHNTWEQYWIDRENGLNVLEPGTAETYKQSEIDRINHLIEESYSVNDNY